MAAKGIDETVSNFIPQDIDIDRAKKFRAVKKQLVTKYINKCTALIVKKSLNRDHYDELKILWVNLQQAHEIVLHCSEEEDIEKDNYLDQIDLEMETIREYFWSLPVKTIVSNSNSVKNSVTRKKVDPPKFRGEIMEYYIWRSNFRKNFESSDNSLAMLQLLEALGENERKRVDHMIISGTIDDMFKTLDSAYGDKRKICQKIMEEVRAIPPCRKGVAADFRNLFDTISLTLSRLRAIDCGSYLCHFNSVQILERKLPLEYKEKWAEKAIAVAVDKSFDELYSFMEKQVLVAEQLDRMMGDNSNSEYPPSLEASYRLTYQPVQQQGYSPTGTPGIPGQFQQGYSHTGTPGIQGQIQQGYSSTGTPSIQGQNQQGYSPNGTPGIQRQIPGQSLGQPNNQMLGPKVQLLNDANRCPLHDRFVNHTVSRCFMLKGATVNNQVMWLSQALADYCRVCLKKGHGADGSNCKVTISCHKCQGRHFDWIHEALDIVRRNDKSSNKCYQVAPNQVLGRYQGKTICPAHYGDIKSPFGREHVSILYDCGANVSMVRSDLAEELKLPKLDSQFLCFSTVSGEEVRVNTYRYRVFITNPDDNSRTIEIVAFGVPKIGADFPVLPQGLRPAASKLGVVELMDRGLLRRPVGRLDILIGADFAQFMPVLSKPANDGLILAENALGFVMYGTHESFTGMHPNHYRAHVLLTTARGINDRVLDFFSTEGLGVEVSVKCGDCKCGKCAIGTDEMTLREQKELEMVKSTMRHDPVLNIITASYPSIKDIAELGNNFPMVMKCLQQIEKDLGKDDHLAIGFQEAFSDMIRRGVARKLTNQEISEWSGAVNYLPMQYVLKHSSASTPLRIVLDTARKFRNKSITDFWPKGPNLISNLLGLLIRFREGPVAILGDISKMYQTIYTSPDTWHLHRLLWRDLDESREPDVYVITRNSFGSKPAGLVAILGLHMAADIGKEKAPKGARCLKEQMYVDDCLESCDSLEEAISITREIDECLALASFTIKEWKYIGEGCQTSDDSSHDLVSVGSVDTESVLGVKLNVSNDEFTFHPRINFSKRLKRSTERTSVDLIKGQIFETILVPTLTKRMIVSVVMSIFDPMGFLCPFMTELKFAMAKLWRFRFPDGTEVGWDSRLPDEFDCLFREILDKSFDLKTVAFPRCLKPKNSVGQPWLVLCSDSSTKCYGAVAYIRWCCEEGDAWSRIIVSKSRIWPIKSDDYLSIVRGELQGAVMAKRLAVFILEQSRFSFERVIFLVDSEIVRAQISSDSHAFDVFVGRRVAEIRKSTNPEQWFWVSGQENQSADLLTRGTTDFTKLDSSSVWQRGPDFFRLPFSEWPIHQSLSADRVLPEKKRAPESSSCQAMCYVCEDISWSDVDGIRSGPHALGSVMISQSTFDRQAALLQMIDIERFSDVTFLHRVTARTWHMIQWTPNKGAFIPWCFANGVVDAKAVEEAQNMWLRQAQLLIIPDVKKGQFKKLIPYVDENGVWRANGRFKKGEGYHPVILENSHPYTKLLACKIHSRGHNGVTATMAKIRSQYHVINLHSLASQIRKDCSTCKILDHKTESVPMAKLPLSRTRPFYPFENISIDIFGPFLLAFPGKVTRGRSISTYGKGYGVLFSCLTTRGIHIEAIEGCSTNSFLLGFRRMMTIRGQPRTVWSDNGGQLVAADTELRNIVDGWDNDALRRFGATEGIQWNFSAPGAPWQNGVTEALIKSAKRALRVVMENKPKVPIIELQTLFYEVASLVNERPLNAAVLRDAPDVQAGTYLCPNQLMYGRSTARIFAGPFRPVQVSDENRFRLVQQYVEEWWKKWSEDVLPIMMKQSKWFSQSRSVRVGDIVHVRDLNPIRGEWKIAEVIQATPSDDGVVRNVQLRYKTPGSMPGARPTYLGTKDRTEIRDVKTLVVIVPVEGRKLQDQ